MNFSQCFEESGSCISDHVNVAVLAEPRLAVAKGLASASNLPFSLNHRNKGTNRDLGRLHSLCLPWKQTGVSLKHQCQEFHSSPGQSLPALHHTEGFPKFPK